MKYKLILIYLLFLTFIVPWYWPADVTIVYFGFPLWAIVSLGVGLLVSILTAYILLSHRSDTLSREDD